jgi:ribosomal protein S18 acetylase RimI-like enzyme
VTRKADLAVDVRNTRPDDFEGIGELTRRVYPQTAPWSAEQLASHLAIFPEGQFVAVQAGTPRVVGMAASLIVRWDEYVIDASWRAFTDQGRFTNHDPERGRTLYAAEVMVDPALQGRGIGSRIYQARRSLVEKRGLLRIRAGARLRGYREYASGMDAVEYATRVVRGEIFDPTLSFQLRRGFRVLAVVDGYLRHDPESLGYAAVIEWINEAVARPEDWAGQPPRFAPRS